MVTIKFIEKVQMLCLGFEPSDAGCSLNLPSLAIFFIGQFYIVLNSQILNK